MILVTGATGLVGSQLCADLQETGTPFRAMKRSSGSIPESLKHAEWVEADLLDFQSLLMSMEDVDVVIHVAAMISFYKGDKDQLYDVNVEGTKNVVDAALLAGVKSLLYVSSVGALGRPEKQAIIDENWRWVPSKDNTYYGETKYLAELEVWRGMEEGLQVAIVSPSVILGQGDWSKGSTRLFKYAWEEHKFFPSGSINYVDNRDVSQCIRVILENNLFGNKYILSAGKTSFKNFFRLIALQLNKRPPKYMLPSRLNFIVIYFAALKAFVTGTKPFVTRETLHSSKKEYLYDASNTKKMLNFAFRNLEDSVEWVCEKL